jgi:hypothetical protein
MRSQQSGHESSGESPVGVRGADAVWPDAGGPKTTRLGRFCPGLTEATGPTVRSLHTHLRSP